MSVSYKNLWKILIDKEMKKTSLQRLAGISSASMAKLGKNENVTTETLCKICAVLHCNIGDLVEYLPDEEKDCKLPCRIKEGSAHEDK